jgi:hypothetical protein
MSILLLVILMMAMGVRWWVAAPVAVLATVLIQQTFAGLLRVPLPLGPLGL